MLRISLTRSLEDECSDEAEECEDLDECQTEEHQGLQTTAKFRLAGGALDRLTDQDAQTDARTNGCKTVADAFRLPATSARVTISIVISFLVIAFQQQLFAGGQSISG